MVLQRRDRELEWVLWTLRFVGALSDVLMCSVKQ